jgi:threonine/homoserine/homoserine lactone efflux protein
MLAIIVKGILLGLSIGFFFGFGPAFFAIIQTAIYRGPFRGALMAFGVFLSDSLMVILTLIGAASIIESSENSEIMGFVGGFVIIVFGIYIFRKRSMRTPGEEKKELDIKNPHPAIYPFKGFLLNVANPFIWLFWAGIVMGVAAPFKANLTSLILFFSATLLTIFTTDLTKVFISHKVKNIVNDRFLMAVNKLAGIGLFGFGVYLIVKTLLVVIGA